MNDALRWVGVNFIFVVREFVNADAIGYTNVAFVAIMVLFCGDDFYGVSIVEKVGEMECYGVSIRFAARDQIIVD